MHLAEAEADRGDAGDARRSPTGSSATASARSEREGEPEQDDDDRTAPSIASRSTSPLIRARDVDRERCRRRETDERAGPASRRRASKALRTAVERLLLAVEVGAVGARSSRPARARGAVRETQTPSSLRGALRRRQRLGDAHASRRSGRARASA